MGLSEYLTQDWSFIQKFTMSLF